MFWNRRRRIDPNKRYVKLDLRLDLEYQKAPMDLLLTQLRKAHGWTKAELARRSSLNASTVGAIENGRVVPYASQLRKLAKALGYPLRQCDQLTQEVTTDEARQAKHGS